jgi:glycosyltransferase involved in cell wall biosynthesis
MAELNSLSAFFPAFNEEANVGQMVNGFRAILPQVAEDYEIIIVNNGSKDRTREIADRLVKEDSVGTNFTKSGYSTRADWPENRRGPSSG